MRRRIKKALLAIPFIRYYLAGKNLLTDPTYAEAVQKSRQEWRKAPHRSEVINYLLLQRSGPTRYLEIGVRYPEDNFDRIAADERYGVDPGKENAANPVDFKMTSDDFFARLKANELLGDAIRFDVIFIDGLHRAEQVDKDIQNAMAFIREDGFVVLHDCNPPTEWHAREDYAYRHSPAGEAWNGTTWKAFVKWRCRTDLHSCCIDTDWGVGILSKTREIGNAVARTDPFYDYTTFAKERESLLGLITFDELQQRLAARAQPL